VTNRGPIIPDPVNILDRLAALESSIDAMKKDVSEITQRRTDLAIEVSDLLLNNSVEIHQVSFVRHQIFMVFFIMLHLAHLLRTFVGLHYLLKLCSLVDDKCVPDAKSKDLIAQVRDQNKYLRSLYD